MLRWACCEIEVVYKGSGTQSSMHVLTSGGSHAQSSGRYGEMMAALGEQGWELVAAPGVRTRDDPPLKMFFRRRAGERAAT